MRPRLQEGTGGVVNGALTVPVLMPEGWNPSFSVAMAVSFAHDFIAQNQPVIDGSVPPTAFYNAQAFNATQERLRTARAVPAAYLHPRQFKKSIIIYSGAFAARVMSLSIPPGFEAGNKALLPVAMLELLARGETEALVEASEWEGAGTAEAGAGYDDARDASFSESAAMVFELTGALGVASFVGAGDFSVPHPDVVVLPSALMGGLCAGEGSTAALRRVALPPVSAITLQPHGSAFWEGEADAAEAGADALCRGVGGTGLSAREFLEAALTRHVSLQAGDVIVCDAGGVSDAVDYAGELSGMFAASAAAAGAGGGDSEFHLPPSSGSFPHPAGDSALGSLDDETLRALLEAGVPLEELGASAQLASSLERAQQAKAQPAGPRAPAPVAPVNSAFRFTVISVEPCAVPGGAGALWQAFASQVAIDLLPAADEYLVPPQTVGTVGAAAAAAGTGEGASPAVGVWRPPALLPSEVTDSVLPPPVPVTTRATSPAGTTGQPAPPVTGGYVLGGGRALSAPTAAAEMSNGGAVGTGTGHAHVTGARVRHLAPSARSASSDGANPTGKDERDDRRRRAAEAAARRLQQQQETAR